MSEIQERITAKTGIIAVIGDPISHSKSPSIHNESFRKLGLDYVDIAIRANHENIEDVTKALKTINARGWNITTPCKEDMMKLCDQLTPAGEMIEAVNTVINNDGVLTGTSTDGIGFMSSLKDGNIDPVGKKMTMFGCGGAATAILVQAALDGVKEISIFNRKDAFWPRAEKKVAEVNEKTNCKVNLFDLADQEALRREINESYLLVNGTNVGMGKLEGMMCLPDASYLREDLHVYDLIYFPKMTKFLQTAKEANCKTEMNGEAMLLYQAAASFKLWFNEEMPVEHLKKILNVDPVL